MLLTDSLTKIRIKQKLTFVIIVLAPIFILFKTWVYCQFTNTKNLGPISYDLFGIFPNQSAKTFVVDVVVFGLSCLLVLEYKS